jgi:hypothetical protein
MDGASGGGGGGFGMPEEYAGGKSLVMEDGSCQGYAGGKSTWGYSGGHAWGAGGGGGGAGGVVYKESVFVSAGEHPIVIGQGGAFGETGGENGGDSTALGFVAHGGGCGGRSRNWNPKAGNGGSGGGASAAYGSSGEIGDVGQALGIDDNIGHDGGSVPAVIDRHKRSGGGGGAGEAGHESNTSKTGGGGGGDGIVCDISGSEVWYAGGGGATCDTEANNGWVVDETTGNGKGGKGGGGNAGCAGTDGLGGGGGGDAKGGSGVVIIRYKTQPDGFSVFVR